MLVSLADMKDYLGIADASYDAFLTSQITIISDAIEGYCGRKFLAADYTQVFEGQDFESDDTGFLHLFHYPINSITSVKEISYNSDATTNEKTYESTEYGFHDLSGKIYKKTKGNQRMSWFSEYGVLSQVEIVYNAGYATCPAPIEDCVYNLVSERYNKKVNGIELAFGNDVQRVSIPGVMSIDFDYTLQANERKSAYGMIIGNYSNVLDLYRSERRIMGSIRENYVS